MAEIVVIGGGGHAKVLISLLKKLGWDILGYTDEQDRGLILGVPYLGDDGVLPGVLEDASVLLGDDRASGRSMRRRRAPACSVRSAPSVSIRPWSSRRSAVVNEDVELGAGTAVFDGAVVNSGTVAGSRLHPEHEQHGRARLPPGRQRPHSPRRHR